jgi:hypothetical protein
MAGTAHSRATAVGIDAWNIVLHGGFHERQTLFAIDLVLCARELYERNYRHGYFSPCLLV